MSRFYHFFLLLIGCFPFTVLFSQSQHQLDSLEALIPVKKGKEKVILLNDLTFYYCQTASQKAILFGEQSLTLAKTLNDKKLLANTYNDLSMPYITAGNYEKVIELNAVSLKLRKELKDTSGYISSYSKLGNAYYELGRYKDAQDAYNEAIRFAKILKNKDLLAQLYNNTSNVLESSGYVEEALKMQQDIYKIATETENKDLQISSLGNQANCYRKLKQFSRSRTIYLRTISALSKENNLEKLAIAYQGIGVTEDESGNKDQSLVYYKKALGIYRIIHADLSEGMVAVNIGNRFAEMNRIDSAEFYMQYGLQLLKKTNSYKEIHNAYRSLSQLEIRKPDFKQAVTYLELQLKYKDSMLIHSGNEVLSEMFARYEVEKKERELAGSKANAAELKLRQVIWTGISFLLFVVVLGVFLYFRRKRKLAQLEMESRMQEEQFLREKQLSDQKMEISRELHDNIGSQITYMISSMDNLSYITDEENVAGRIKNISEFGRETMTELRSTIWAMNTEEGSVTLLFRKIEELRSKVPLTLRLLNNLEEEYPLRATEMLNLYRIAQEFIQNTLKYALATEITISANKKADGFELHLKDNGKGFDPESSNGGNGLRNMKYRCEQLGGTFELQSEPGSGTKVSCRLRHLSY